MTRTWSSSTGRANASTSSSSSGTRLYGSSTSSRLVVILARPQCARWGGWCGSCRQPPAHQINEVCAIELLLLCFPDLAVSIEASKRLIDRVAAAFDVRIVGRGTASLITRTTMRRFFVDDFWRLAKHFDVVRNVGNGNFPVLEIAFSCALSSDC